MPMDAGAAYARPVCAWSSLLAVAAVGALPVAFRKPQPALDHLPYGAATGALQLVRLLVDKNDPNLLHLTL